MDQATIENPNCEKTIVSFRLEGDAIDPEEITALTGFTPIFSCRKGEEFVIHPRYGTPKTLKRRFGVWVIESQGAVASTSAENHLAYLLDLLAPYKEALLALMQARALTAEFLVYWVSATGTGGPMFSDRTLRQVADYAAYLTFEFQGPFDEEESVE